MKKTYYSSKILGLITLLFLSCKNSAEKPLQTKERNLYYDSSQGTRTKVQPETDTIKDHTVQIPILAYHQIREWRSTDTKSEKVYIIPPATFKEEIKMLHDSGFHTILPDQLMAYLEKGEKLPSRPVMITFDDATGPQYDIGMAELNKYGYKGVFFIMTVVLGRPDYMTKAEVKDISVQGHVIGCHTWDHHPVTKYDEKDWEIQLKKPIAELQQITGLPVKYFAYPYGAWNKEAIVHLMQGGIVAAFQLAEHQDKDEPLYTIRRIIADGEGNSEELLKEMKRDFRIYEN